MKVNLELNNLTTGNHTPDSRLHDKMVRYVWTWSCYLNFLTHFQCFSSWDGCNVLALLCAIWFSCSTPTVRHFIFVESEQGRDSEADLLLIIGPMCLFALGICLRGWSPLLRPWHYVSPPSISARILLQMRSWCFQLSRVATYTSATSHILSLSFQQFRCWCYIRSVMPSSSRTSPVSSLETQTRWSPVWCFPGERS